ncbi:phage tail tube protein [Streptomyces sp. 4N509B]|uniref:phage tail tube protein n=1 Tax=Streptomyces sp. 4N509B TaxID=3457413 RepID=UPI003FD0DC21
MAKDTDNARAWYGFDSGLWVTLPGEPVPAFPLPPIYDPVTGAFTPPGEEFYELGWLSEDGPTQGRERNVERFRGWQGNSIVRTAVTEDDHTVQIQALEDNWVVQQLRYPDSIITTTGDTTQTVVVQQSGEDVRSGVLDLVDGDVWKRIFIPRLVVDEMGDVPHTAGELTMYEMTLLCKVHTMTVDGVERGVALIENTNNPAMIQPGS